LSICTPIAVKNSPRRLTSSILKNYRLISADYNDGNFVDYTYDALGNRDEVNDTAPAFNYDVNCINQYTSVGGTSYHQEI